MYNKINLAVLLTLVFTASVFAKKDNANVLSRSSKTIHKMEKETKINPKKFFPQETLALFTERINKITPESQRVWGTMSPDQMLHHLNLACGSSMGYFNLPDESSFMTRTMGKWFLVSWKPTMPKGLKNL
ncbi:hypothetical protein KHA90_20445 [Flavobacterium psychroterrae]|uniref:Uncharacterized protein n=1 Tax=Flavobacterium psychroterrae TaxID=2133767 RepID=A0ABS5PI68_9FLAO|nr:hypothetical protein [Flavobacterium psychroterrae]MBS7233391.1 hypothetical protein [Flavobacterium psychroterrae]